MNAVKQLTPLLNRVLIMKMEAPKVTSGGIMLPEIKQKEQYRTGKILAVGTGITNNEGNFIPMCLKPGDDVLFPNIGGIKIKCDEKECYLHKDNEILAVV